MFFHDIDKVRVFIKPGFTDMRKSIDGLSIIAQENMAEDPFSGNLFLFCNKRRQILKSLYWDRNGFCLWHKRLEKHRFPWPNDEGDKLLITQDQLKWLLEGVDFFNRHEKLTFSSVI